MYIEKINQLDLKWNQLIAYASNCSWIAGKHLANMLEKMYLQNGKVFLWQ